MSFHEKDYLDSKPIMDLEDNDLVSIGDDIYTARELKALGRGLEFVTDSARRLGYHDELSVWYEIPHCLLPSPSLPSSRVIE